MLASHTWLMELSGLDLTPQDVAQKLTSAGLEVEDARPWGQGLDGVVVAEVRSIRPHPERDKLRLVSVWDGSAEQEVVCGAPNVPEAGGRVLLATLGTKLPGGMEIAERQLGGVTSKGMLCSETELGIGSDESGIVVLGDEIDAAPGEPVATALSLADTVYEIGLTPNRPDCLGHVGLARELCAVAGEPFSPPAASGALRLGKSHDSIRVDLEDPQRCPRYGAAFVSDVKVAPSPFGLRYRLHVLGLRAISNVVDATNLILLGFGHPIHAFDFDKLGEGRILVRLARDGEVMRTLDGEQRRLSEDDLLICDGNGPVALAGVMGGADSEIGPETTRVLIECAYFDPRSVRRTSKRTGLHTDSSHRFERGVDPNGVPTVLAHAAAMIGELGGGAVAPAGLDVYPRPVEQHHVRLRRTRVEALLGTPVDPAQVTRLLAAVGCFQLEMPASLPPVDGWDMLLPTHRPDLKREVDLIEEIARLLGYDSIPTELPAVAPSAKGSPPEIGFLRRVRQAAAAAGLNEAIHFAFLSPAQLEACQVPTRAVKITNPLSEERSVLRTSLLPSLVDNLRQAQHQQLKRFAHFELARVFIPTAERLPEERAMLGVMMWGQRKHWFSEGDRIDFYDVKSALNSIIHGACAVRPTVSLASGALSECAPYLHPRRRASVEVGGRSVGHLGELHPDLVDRLGLDGRPVYGSLDMALLAEASDDLGETQARTLPKFPAVTRDLAVVVFEEHQAGDVSAVLQEAAGALCEEVALFDIYRGQPVQEGHKSLAFHVVYRDPETTLTDKVVDKLHARVVKAAESSFGAALR